MSDDELKGDEEPKSPLDRLTYLTNENKDRSKRSRKQEQRVADLLGGRRLPNSGAKPKSKWARVARISNVSFTGEKLSEVVPFSTLDGDITAKQLHIEHKSTVKDSISVKREWWDKVKDGAASTDTIPALVITFESRRASEPHEDIACVPLSVLKKLMGIP